MPPLIICLALSIILIFGAAWAGSGSDLVHPNRLHRNCASASAPTYASMVSSFSGTAAVRLAIATMNIVILISSIDTIL